MKRKEKKNPIKGLKRRAWEAFSRFIRLRDPLCVTCGAPTAHAGHYQNNSERKQDLGGNSLWYDERNVHGQCVGCNLFKSGNLAAYAIFLEKTYGVGILQELNVLYRTAKKWTREEIEGIIERYEI